MTKTKTDTPPAHSTVAADRTELGVLINLNIDEFFTRVVSAKEPDHG